MIAVVQQTDLGPELSEDPAARNELLNDVRSSIWSYPQGSSLLTVAASHADPRIAQQLATAIVDTYLQWKINLGLEGSMSAQDFFVGLVSDYQSELEPVQRELTDYLTTHPEPLRGERPPSEVAEIARLQAKVDQALERLRAAESKEENARLATVQTESDVRQTYFTVDEPTIPIESTRSLRKHCHSNSRLRRRRHCAVVYGDNWGRAARQHVSVRSRCPEWAEPASPSHGSGD